MTAIDYLCDRVLPKVFHEGPSGFVLCDGSQPVRHEGGSPAPVVKKGKDGKERDMSGKGSKRSHKGSRQSRPGPWKRDVIKARMDLSPLSDHQRQWAAAEWRKAWKVQADKAYDERSFDDFRREEIHRATATHEAGQVDGLSKARKAHFNALMSEAYKWQGESGKALEWAAKDDGDARRLSLVLHLIRELLSRLPPKPGMEAKGEEVDAYRKGWGDTFAHNLYGVPVDRLSADQADYVYTRMQAELPKREMERRAGAWMASRAVKPGESPIEVLARLSAELEGGQAV